YDATHRHISSGSKRVDSAVEPTRSQNITVRWRRSASSRDPVFGSVAESAGEASPSPAMARSILRRCPSSTPSSFRSWSVRSRRIEKSMAFSAKRWAYSRRPIDSSHSAVLVMALLYHRWNLEKKQHTVPPDANPRRSQHDPSQVDPTSASGQKQTSEREWIMSALPPKTDMDWHSPDVRFVPKA